MDFETAELLKRLRKHPVLTMDKQNVTSDAADLIELLQSDMSDWINVDVIPDEGDYIVTAETDGRRWVTLMEFDGALWMHEGEPTFCHSWECTVISYQPLPPPDQAAIKKPVDHDDELDQ